MGEVVLMQGNEAVVEGAIAAGMRIYAGYPITPSTEIAERSAVRLPQVGGKFIQMEDEIGSIACAIGASVAGVKAMTATSGPGFSLKQENLGYACLAEIPLVLVDVQRQGPSTGMPTSHKICAKKPAYLNVPRMSMFAATPKASAQPRRADAASISLPQR